MLGYLHVVDFVNTHACRDEAGFPLGHHCEVGRWWGEWALMSTQVLVKRVEEGWVLSR